MISETSHHLFQPLLYQVATGVLSEGEVAPATREVLKRQKNATVLLGRVTEIDIEAKTVTSVSPLGTTVTPYDTLIVAAGAGQSYFGNDQFSEFAPGMKSIDDALELRGRIFGSFELAELCEDPEAGGVADLRGGRCRSDRGRDGRPDQRAGAPYAAPGLPSHRHDKNEDHPARRSAGRARDVRRQALRLPLGNSSSTSAWTSS